MTKYIKLIEDLYAKALLDGEATKNGRMNLGWGIKGDLQEKYAIEFKGVNLHLRHWGTETLVLDMNNRTVIDYYGESNSDRDSLNMILMLTGTKGKFRWLPSKNSFIYEYEAE